MNICREDTSISKKNISYADPYRIRTLIEKNSYDPYELFLLNLEAFRFQKYQAIDKLISMDLLRTKIDAHPYQMKVALSVLNDMKSNAILADEVGLGKTIEAGIILKELLLRKMIESILIIVPKALLNQWQDELKEKFGEQFIIANDNQDFIGFDDHDKIICSNGLLLHRRKHIMNREWDLIIVDEAHVYRNTKSKGRTYLSQIPKKHLLLLTATPLNNKLTDIFSLVDLVYPGQLESERTFISRYAADSKCRVVRGDAVNILKNNISQVMCRTRRIETDIPFTNRFVETRKIDANAEERYFIDKSTEYLKEIYNKYADIDKLKNRDSSYKIRTEAQSRAILIFQAISLQQSFSSSPSAALEALQKRYYDHYEERKKINELISLLENVKSSKLQLLENVLKEIESEQAVIYCSRKATTYEIKRILDEEYGSAEVYSGDVTSSLRRKDIIDDFRKKNIKYLVATDAAAEGLNLQNCSIMFNYDLHWNPMKIEQRIGRIHRFGQDRDVSIFNLCVKDTIDDYVLHILFQKIELFTMTIGSMETILSELKEDYVDIEQTIMEIILRCNNKRDIEKELDDLSKDINYQKKKQSLAEEFTEGVLG